MKINFSKAKKNIASLWFIFSSILFVLVFIQSISGKYEDKIQEACGWFFPLIMPMLTLMITVFVHDIKNSNENVSEIDIFYYRLSFGLSAFYLTAIFCILILQPLTNRSLIELMKESSIYLGPFQGLVTGSMGLFFANKEN